MNARDVGPNAEERLGERRVARTRVWKGWWRWMAVAAAAAIVGAWLAAGYVAAIYEARIGQMARENTVLRTQLRHAEVTLVEQIAVYRDAVDLLRDPATRVVELRGQGTVPAAAGCLILHEKSGSHVFVANLPPAPTGKTYELWTIAGPTPQAAGIFQTDSDGRGHQAIAAGIGAGARVKVFTVTLEPSGGVPLPTGPTVLSSK